MSSYAFGDSQVAADRLAVLAAVFKDTTSELLSSIPSDNRREVVDLGCGPGYTTLLLRDVLSPERLVGIDAAPVFAREAAGRLGSSAAVVVADVAALPAAVSGVGLMFARFLLTHLADPAAAVEHWLTRLAPDGLITLEEVESITTNDPAFDEYLALQRLMLDANANRLETGPLIAQVARGCRASCNSDVVKLTPSPAAAARRFAMNFTTWRDRPAVTDSVSLRELDAIGTGLLEIATGRRRSAPITWELRQAHRLPATES